MKPVQIETANAKYLITYTTRGHAVPDPQYLNYNPSIVVPEFAFPGTEEVVSARYPDPRTVELVRHRIGGVHANTLPVAYLDPPVLPALEMKRLQNQSGRRQLTGTLLRTIGSATTATGLAGYAHRQHTKGKTESEKPVSRRAFFPQALRKATRAVLQFSNRHAGKLTRYGLATLGVSELLDPRVIDRASALHSTWIEEGRSAWIAHTCETQLAPYMQKHPTEFNLKPNEKPTIAIVIGKAHTEIEQFLKRPTDRTQMLRKFDPIFQLVPPRFQNTLFIFRPNDQNRLIREEVDSKTLRKRTPDTRPQARLPTRRDLFRRAGHAMARRINLLRRR